MPCYTVQLTSVVFKAKYRRVLDEALKRLGWGRHWNHDMSKVTIGDITIDLKKQEAMVPRNGQDVLNQIKQEYSMIIIEQVAKKKRWVLKKESATKAILRRY